MTGASEPAQDVDTANCVSYNYKHQDPDRHPKGCNRTGFSIVCAE